MLSDLAVVLVVQPMMVHLHWQPRSQLLQLHALRRSLLLEVVVLYPNCRRLLTVVLVQESLVLAVEERKMRCVMADLRSGRQQLEGDLLHWQVWYSSVSDAAVVAFVAFLQLSSSVGNLRSEFVELPGGRYC